MAGAEGPRRALAMDEETGRRSVDVVLLDFTGIMGDIVQQRKGGLRQDVGKDFSDEMRDDLTVG